MSISSLVRLGVVFCLAVLALASCQSPDTPKPDGMGELRMAFVHRGRAVPGSLIVSNGDFRREWKNQTEIKAMVPATATLIIDLKQPGDRTGKPITLRDIIPVFEVPEGGVRDVVVHVPAANQPASFSPVVFLEDRDAGTTIKTKREDLKRLPTRIRLTSVVETRPGTMAFIDGIYNNDAPTAALSRDFTCGDDCPHIYTGLTCNPYCYTCSSTAVVKNGYYQPNYNICEAFSAATPRGSEFDEIPEGQGGIHLAAALRNDGIVFPLRASRRGMGSTDILRPPFDTRSFPDFLAPTGVHLYALTLPGGGLWSRRELVLPVPVFDHRITQLKIDVPAGALTPLTPVLIGDDRLGVPKRSLTSDATETGVTVRVRTPDPDPGHAWVLVPLPRGISGTLVVEDEAGNRLREGDGYATSYYDGRAVIVLRTDGQDATRTVRF